MIVAIAAGYAVAVACCEWTRPCCGGQPLMLLLGDGRDDGMLMQQPSNWVGVGECHQELGLKTDNCVVGMCCRQVEYQRRGRRDRCSGHCAIQGRLLLY